MPHFEISSGQVISDCLKEHGKGELFFRTDGLQFEERRARVRREYLEAHPETTHYEAIMKAGVTPGMTRAEVIAAWGLIEEDMAQLKFPPAITKSGWYASMTTLAKKRGR